MDSTQIDRLLLAAVIRTEGRYDEVVEFLKKSNYREFANLGQDYIFTQGGYFFSISEENMKKSGFSYKKDREYQKVKADIILGKRDSENNNN